MPNRRARTTWFPLACLVAALTVPPARGQGPVLAGAGPVNRSMGGAATAAPLDATGTLYWNPAGIAGLPGSELDFGLELLYPRSAVASAVPAGALGPGFPPVRLSGRTRAESGVFALPTAGLVFRPGENSDWTLGVGVFPAAGFGTNFAGGPDNPILSPPPPAGLGVGPVYSEYQVFQIVPAAAYRLTDRLAVGAGPVVDLAYLSVDPDLFSPPDDANGDGVPSYPAATHTRSFWGGGFQVGVYYVASDAWRFGASYKSRQWFEPARSRAADEIGRPRTLTTNLDVPPIASVGVAYTGFDRLVLAVDARYLGFRDTAGFQPAGFGPDGAVTGLGWRDVFALAVGGQYLVTDCLSVRAGYTYNTNPIPARNAVFNLPSMLVYQHQLALGASYRLTPCSELSATYYHIFNNTITGPYVTPVGAIPGATVSDSATGDALIVGAAVRF